MPGLIPGNTVRLPLPVLLTPVRNFPSDVIDAQKCRHSNIHNFLEFFFLLKIFTVFLQSAPSAANNFLAIKETFLTSMSVFSTGPKSYSVIGERNVFFNRTYRLFLNTVHCYKLLENYCYYEIQIHKALCEFVVE